MTKRASILGTDMDLSGFKPKAAPSDAPPPEQIRAIAEANEFHSRETRKAGPLKRRRRTGRNAQFNIRATQETIDAFYEISDTKNWLLSETLERALEALKKSLADK